MEGVFSALDRFFIDIIGTVIPGSFFILGVWVLLSQPALFGSISIFPVAEISGWTLLIALSYVAGHAISSLGKGLTSYIIEPAFTKGFFSEKKINFIKSGNDLREQIKQRADFNSFVSCMEEKYPQLKKISDDEKNFGFWRNVALSVSKDNSLVYRFVFISLLNLGIATDLILLAVLWIVFCLLARFNLIQNIEPINWVAWTFLGLSSLPFLERYYQFHRRSLQIPFSMALVVLEGEGKEISSGKVDFENRMKSIPSAKPRVYLAGGFCSGWQDKVKLSIPNFEYFDPRQHHLSEPGQYTLWDLEAIHQCNIVFAYLEIDNPGGYALALELGYAKALGKIIIFVEEVSTAEENQSQYFAMLRASSGKVFSSLDEGLMFLQSLSTIYN